MTDAEKNPRRYVLLKEMRVREKKREKGRGRRRERKGQMEGEKKPLVSFPRSTGDAAILYPACICIPFARSFIKTSRTTLRSQIDPHINVAARVSGDFTLPKIH